MPVSLCLRESNNFWMLKSNLIDQSILQVVRVVFNNQNHGNHNIANHQGLGSITNTGRWFGLFPIGLERGASFVNQSLCIVMQNQKNVKLVS